MMHSLHSTVHQTNVHRLASRLNSEWIGPSNIARVYNAASDWLQQNMTLRQCSDII